eukprot:SAG31_NODE_11688_length_1006_cov_1.775083_1_plen_71_part_10
MICTRSCILGIKWMIERTESVWPLWLATVSPWAAVPIGFSRGIQSEKHNTLRLYIGNNDVYLTLPNINIVM